MTRLHDILFLLSSLILTTSAADGYTNPNDNGGSMLTVLSALTGPAKFRLDLLH